MAQKHKHNDYYDDNYNSEYNHTYRHNDHDESDYEYYDNYTGRESVAYDFSLFEEEEATPVLHEHRNPQRESAQARRKKEVRTFARRIACVVFAVGLCAVFLTFKAEYGRVYANVEHSKKVLTALKSENNRLQFEIDSKLSRDVICAIAENELHMQKLDPKYQVEYVEVSTKDKLKIVKNEKENIFEKLKKVFN